MIVVVVDDKYLGHAIIVIGPFDTTQQATTYANEKDWQLDASQRMRVHTVLNPTSIFQREWKEPKGAPC